jgi:hypothetical protein
MVNKTTRWTCDVCGEAIDDSANNYVQWVEVREPEADSSGRDLRITHNSARCSLRSGEEYAADKGLVCDLPISSLLGPDGLMRCLSLISDGGWRVDQGIEIIKRLQIPGYEEARPYLDAAVAAGLVEPNLPPGFYWQHEIARVLEHKADL